MRNLLKAQFISLAVVIGCALFSCAANAEYLNHYLDFYAGIDAQLRDMRFKEGYGNNLLRKRLPQSNMYVGVMLNDHMSLEIGHESTFERSCVSTFSSGECAAGVQIPKSIEPVTFKSKVRIKGAHFDLVGFYPLNFIPVKLIGSIGISSLKGTVERKTLKFGNPSIESGMVRTMHKHKATFRFMGGVQYVIDGGLAFRTSISLIRTGRMVIKKDDVHSSVYVPMIKPKDTIVYNMGILYKF